MSTLKYIWKVLSEIADAVVFVCTNRHDGEPQPAPILVQPVATSTPAVVQPPAPVLPLPKYLWNNPKNVKHSVRVICDEEGLNLEQKNTMCATIGAESNGYNIHAVNQNKAGNVLYSTDWGLCQWNDHYHGKEISCGYNGDAYNNPEKAVRLMASYWKLGETHRCMWIAYKNGLYKKYL